MHLELREASPADAPRIVVIQRDSYADKPFNAVLFPGPFPDDVLDRQAAELAETMGDDPTARWFTVVVDAGAAGAEKTVAFAKWHVWDPKPPPGPPRPLGPWANADACEALFGGLAKQQERIMRDRSYVYLQMLCTSPKHRRQGAGAMLVKRVLDEATRLGLPAYVESSKAGHSLYQKCGFVDVEEHNIDMHKWGRNATHTTWAMIRGVPS